MAVKHGSTRHLVSAADIKRRRRQSSLTETATQQVDCTAADGWKRGQIVRIRLHNFLTFDDVEVYPSPHLNVIVGPNGTGKSSVVCAICIGLGGRPTLLGRAKELKDYVKHNTVEGWVELELYSGRGKNWVVRRLLTCDANTSSWMLNGKEVPKKEVDKVTADLHIQLDNKCQFLPQDMVVEFARMDACSLLEETEKAIGPEDLHANHSKLKDLQKNRHSSRSRIQEKVKQREVEMGRNQLLQRDVERFNNRKQFLTQIKHLKMKKCWLEYQEGRAQFQELKDARKKAVREYRMASNEYQPIAEKHEQQEKAVSEFVRSGQEAREGWRRCMRGRVVCRERLEGLEDEVESLGRELEERKKGETKRRKRVATLQTEIQAYSAELEQMEDPSSVCPLISEKNSEIRSVSEEVARLMQGMQEIGEQREEHIQHMRRCEEELGQMQNVRNQRMRLLQRVDRDTHEAVLWLEQHRHLFNKHVFEPILLSVNVRDSSYTSQVEAVLAGKDFYSFVTLTKEDKSTLLKELSDRKRLKINVVMAPNHDVSQYRPDIPSSTLNQYGFAGMVMDCIEAPGPQLAFYCHYHNLHNIPLAHRLSPRQLEMIMKDLPNLRRFFTHDTQYSLTRSRYSDKVIMKSGKIMPPRFLRTSVDVQRKAELEGEIQEAQRLLGELDGRYSDLQKKQDDLRREDNRLRQEKNQLKVKIDSYKQAQSNISSRKTKLRGIENTHFDVAAEEEKLKQEVEKIHWKRTEDLGKFRLKLEEGKVKLGECCKAWVLTTQAKIRVTQLLQQYRVAKAKMDSAEQARLARESEELAVKTRVQQLLQTARRVSGIHDPQENQELMSIFNTFPDELDEVEERIHECQAQADLCMGIDEEVCGSNGIVVLDYSMLRIVEERIHECQAQADLCMGIDEEAVREYEEREEVIRELDREISRMQELSENADSEMNDLKERWLTPLKDLLGMVSVRFSEYFRLMSCVGEVALHEDPMDFGQYSVKISVKFRDSEQLQPLNAQRQSGGERSVSTMLYLMSLQGITACPFRVVDEINQGMDPVNERRVFDLIVAATKQGTDTSQYFILTPKLLRDLDYTDTVTVHVVQNGQEMPTFKKWTAHNFLC